ncbi:MAG: cation transporter [Elusimicrobia bacterium]|nr:cation transporter [Elusimicrobiota bacterium]
MAMLAAGVLATGAAASAAEQIYHLEASWTETGGEHSRFQEPMGIAVDSSGDIYVCDSRNRRIVKLSGDGRFLLQFGERGRDAGQFEKPMDVAVAHGGVVYVVDFDLDRVQAFSPEGKYMYGWGGTGGTDGRFRGAAGLALDASGYVYVADFYNDRVQVFGPKGEWVRTFGRKGHGVGELDYPAGLAFDLAGNLIVADAYNHRLQEFLPTGQALRTIGSRAKRIFGMSSAFHVPSGIAVDAQGNLHVADSANKRVALLDREGSYRGDWKVTDDANSGVYSPTRIAAMPDGRVLAADTANDRILVLGLGAGPRAANAAGGSTPAKAKPVRGDVLVRVSGMACPFCAYGIEKHLKALPGVSSARVNLGEGTAVLDLVPGQKVPDDEIRQAVQKAGFKASEIKDISATGGR